MYAPRRGEHEIKHYNTKEELVEYLKVIYATAAADPQKYHESMIMVTQGSLLRIIGERERRLVLPDGTTVELHPGPPPPDQRDPHYLLPDSWVS